jgi:hypothetical protein
MADSTPTKKGDKGISVRWSPDFLDGTIGLYARKTSDLLPAANVRLAGYPAAAVGGAACPALVPGAIVTPTGICLFNPATIGTTSRYQLEYANNIGLLGVSLSKSIAGISMGAELSHRTNMPLYSTPALLMPVGTNPIILNGLNTALKGLMIATAAGLPQSGDVSTARGNTYHGIFNMIGTTADTPLWNALTWSSELSWSRMDKITKGAEFYRGRDNYTGIDKPTKDYFGLAVNLTPTWFQVMPGVDMSAPIAFTRGLKGNSQVQAGGNKGAGTYSAGVAFDVRAKYRIDIKYVDFFGDLATDATGAVSSNAGVTSLIRDRGFIAATVKTTF